MTDAQILAISITVLAILVGAMINNTRVGDVKEVLRAELKVNRAETDLHIARLDTRMGELDRSIATLASSMDARFNATDRKLDEILRILGDHETRITGLEKQAK